MKIRILKETYHYQVGHVYTLDDSLIEKVIVLDVSEAVKYGIAEVVEEKEYTGSDMLQFAQYCDTGNGHDLPWYKAFLINENWRQK